MNSRPLSYVLITAARNEEHFIEVTIRSVTEQTILPQKWIIVNDGSTDGTEQIVLNYARRFPWIELLSMPSHRQYAFSAKAHCFNTAFLRLRDMQFDIVGNVDADVSFDRDHFEYLLERFLKHPKLGVAGTPLREATHDAVEDGWFNETDVFGACQLFRRQCIEEIGGYPKIKGGIDWAAVRMARMKGWETRSFLDKRFFHHRVMGATDCGLWRAMINQGEKDYFLGNHPLWQLFRVAYQMTRRPVIGRGLLLLAGYSMAALRRVERPLPTDVIRFHQQEELQRLKSILGRFSFNRHTT